MIFNDISGNPIIRQASGALLEKAPPSLVNLLEQIYTPAGIKVENITPEPESSEYDAYRLFLNDNLVVFRTAKTTPTKIGQFVTLWKRPNPRGEIQPFDSNDGISFVTVYVFDDTHRGLFVFDQDSLLKQGIMSLNGRGGKRAIRVYAPWTTPLAKDAIKTQRWQSRYFLPIKEDGTADLAHVYNLFKFTPADEEVENSERRLAKRSRLR